MVTASQSGKTDALINVLGHRLDDDPVPILYIAPTQKLVESVSNSRVMAMFRTTPSLFSKLSQGKANKMTEKFISGVRLGFGWSGSATELSSHPCGLVLMDERDRMDNDVEGEGDPVDLCEARTATYPGGKVIVCSTPTIEGASPIWSLWEQGTMAEWAWPCPHCCVFFVPRFSLLRWPDDATPNHAQHNAWVECPHCNGQIFEQHKSTMNAGGQYLCDGQSAGTDGAVTGNRPAGDCASFWVSGLASPWVTFGDRAKSWLSAVRSREAGRIQAVINTGFGELYKMSGDVPSWEAVAALREGYRYLDVPHGVQALTVGVDVQKNSLFYVVRGWGYNMESWLLDAGELLGDTAHQAVWEALAGILNRKIGCHDVSRMFIDSGYRPVTGRQSVNMIYSFCRQHLGRAYPTKGHDTLDKPLRMSNIDVSWNGVIIKNGIGLWHIDSDFAKSWVHARVNWPAGESGAWHLSADTTDGFCKMIVAESRVVKPSGAVTWLRLHHENHFLDCESLAFAAAKSLNLEALPQQQMVPTTQLRSRTRNRGEDFNRD